MNVEADLPAPENVHARAGTGWQRIIRFTARTVLVAVVLFLLYLGISLILERRLLLSFASFTGAAMCIPLADAGSRFGERVRWSLMVPFATTGLVGFVFLYFQLFRLPWFEAIFNDKGSGPLGLIVFAIIGLVIGGYAGVWCVTAVGAVLSARRGTAISLQNCDESSEPFMVDHPILTDEAQPPDATTKTQ